MLYLGGCVTVLAVSIWVSIIASGIVGVALAAALMLAVFRRLYTKFPKVAPGLFLVAVVTVLQLLTHLESREVYRYMSEMAGGEVLGQLFAVCGIFLGACPLIGLFVVFNTTVVCMHSDDLSETERLMRNLEQGALPL